MTFVYKSAGWILKMASRYSAEQVLAILMDDSDSASEPNIDTEDDSDEEVGRDRDVTGETSQVSVSRSRGRGRARGGRGRAQGRRARGRRGGSVSGRARGQRRSTRQRDEGQLVQPGSGDIDHDSYDDVTVDDHGDGFAWEMMNDVETYENNSWLPEFR